MRRSRHHSGFTLIEIMVSLMIFVVVSGAMIAILMMSSELFRRGEFSRSANDETVAVLGAVSDDLNHLVPETGDGFFYAGVPSRSGNTLVAFTTAGQHADGIGARGQNSRSLVGMWVEELPGQQPRLRRLVLDDSRDITEFISALVLTSGVGGRVITGFNKIELYGYDQAGNEVLNRALECTNGSPQADKDWYGRQAMRTLAGNAAIADVEFVITNYAWKSPTGTSNGGAGTAGGTEIGETRILVPSTVLTQGCLHFSAWVALNDIPGMERPKDQQKQPDWEQIDSNGNTRLGPWGRPIGGSGSEEAYDTRPKGWLPPGPTQTTAIPKPPFPSALRLSFVLTGGGRFAPQGSLQDDLASDAAAGSFRFTGLQGLPSAAGSMVRVGDEWIAYLGIRGGRIFFGDPAPETGPGRGARRSTIAGHPRGETVRVGQSYSLVRAIPR
jgi:prepilin-type N-terminal cleavage/methylation domain-containing protein